MTGTIAMTHNERWDGLGYPNGEQIPTEVRITALGDDS